MKKIIILMWMCIPLITYGAPASISLDGYFDDWADKPGMQLSYQWNNPGQAHTVKWYVSDTDLYLHIQMGTKGGQNIGYYQIYYYVDNGNRKQLALAPDNPSGGRVSIIDTNGGYNFLTTDGYVVRGSNNNGKTSDKAEFRIPLSTFEKDANNQMFTLRLEFPNLGSQSLSFQAGSTYAYMGILISAAAAGLGMFIYKRKRNKIQ
jgi:uncharacterized protein (TIGR04145 family)